MITSKSTASKVTIIGVALILIAAAVLFVWRQRVQHHLFQTVNLTDVGHDVLEGALSDTIDTLSALHPLSIESLRQREYPASDIVVEETLTPGSNYQRFRVSYTSDGLKIYALLTVPTGTQPETGWPVIVFNHGYIPPAEYRTTERYVAYTDGFSRSGYILIRPDYRGHDRSEGQPEGAYGSNAYTIDVLNAVSAIKAYPGADPERVGLWGHSMGGHITMKAMVVDPSIKVGVIWAGVVASYPDLLNNWRRRSSTFSPPPQQPTSTRNWRERLSGEFGTPEANPEFWRGLSANSYLNDISGPVQLQHGTADTSVPVEFSENLATELEAAGKEVELHIYQRDDHNLSQNFSTAMRRSIEYFDKTLK
ncbi:MAG: alpha/beta fold hydrolase [bacterium]|nr:alpha/beta fold hydrolase [bacterium]